MNLRVLGRLMGLAALGDLLKRGEPLKAGQDSSSVAQAALTSSEPWYDRESTVAKYRKRRRHLNRMANASRRRNRRAA